MIQKTRWCEFAQERSSRSDITLDVSGRAALVIAIGRVAYSKDALFDWILWPQRFRPRAYISPETIDAP